MAIRMLFELVVLGVALALAIASVTGKGPRWLCLADVVVAALLVGLGAFVGAVSREPVGLMLVGVGALPLAAAGVRWRMSTQVGMVLGALAAIALGGWWVLSGGRVTVDAGVSMDPSSIAVIRETHTMHEVFATGLLFGCSAVAVGMWLRRRQAA